MQHFSWSTLATPGPSKWWEKSIFLIPRCQRAEGSNGSIDASNRSPGSRFGGQCSCGLPGHMELASHSGILSFSQIDYFFICTLQLVYLPFCDAESFCPRFWHFPCDCHFPATGALAQSLLGIKWINRIYSLLLFRFSPSQILSTLLSLFFLRCSSTSSEEQLQSSSMTKR